MNACDKGGQWQPESWSNFFKPNSPTPKPFFSPVSAGCFDFRRVGRMLCLAPQLMVDEEAMFGLNLSVRLVDSGSVELKHYIHMMYATSTKP